MRFWICLLWLFWGITIVMAKAPIVGAPTEFVWNKGQWAQPVLFTAQLPQGWLFLEKTGFTYNFLEKEYFESEATEEKSTIQKFKGHAFRVNFVNANFSA